MALEPLVRLATPSRGGGCIPIGISSQTSNINSQHLHSTMRLLEPMVPSLRVRSAATYARRWSSMFASISPSILARRSSWAVSAIAMAGATARALARPRDRDFWTNSTILPTTVAIEAPAATTKNVMYGTLRSSTHSLYVNFLLSRRKSRSPATSYTEANKRIRRETEQAGLKWRRAPKARSTARMRADLHANAMSREVLARGSAVGATCEGNLRKTRTSARTLQHGPCACTTGHP